MKLHHHTWYFNLVAISLFFFAVLISYISVLPLFINERNPNENLHVFMLYYDQEGFSDPFRLEFIETDLMLYNNSNEDLISLVYEPGSTSTSMYLVTIPPGEDVDFGVRLGTFIVTSNTTHTATSSFMVGKNKLLSEKRLVSVVNSLKDQIQPGNEGSIVKTYSLLRKIFFMDRTVNQNCTYIADHLFKKVFDTFGKEVAKKYTPSVCKGHYMTLLNSI